jgi:uncharacterized protein YbjT (DUF2867 family)
METMLVIGATGTTGSEVFRALAATGAPVRAFARDAEKARAMLGASADIAAGDLSDPASLDAALHGVRAVFLASADDPRQVELQGHLIQAAKRAGVRHVVKLSMMDANPSCPVTIGRWHAQTEEDLRRSGLSFTFLQPGFFMQNMRMFRDSIRGASAIYAPAGEAKIAFIDARDIAAVAAVALAEPGHEGKTHVLTGPEALTFSQAAAQLSAALGRTVSFVDVPPEAARQAMLGGGLPPWLVGDLLVMFQEYKRGWRETVNDTIATVTGRPARTFAEFARDHAREFV